MAEPQTPPKQPNIVFFYWDNFGWGELGCYGGGELRGAATPRIDGLAAEGLRLQNFNVEAQCTPSRSSLLTGRHAIRSGTQAVPIAGGPDGSDALGGDDRPGAVRCRVCDGDVGQVAPGQRPGEPEPGRFRLRRGRVVPADSGRGAVDDAVVLPERRGNGRSRMPGPTKIPLEPEPIFSRKKGEKHEVLATYDAEFRAGFDRKITEWATDFMQRSKEAGKPFYVYLPYTQIHIPPIPDPGVRRRRPSAGTGATS